MDVGARDPASDVSELLLTYRRELDAALDGRPNGPVFRELSAARARYDVPGSALHELLDGVARDCVPFTYAQWGELSRYCEGVASSVGEMCTYVFGVTGNAATRAHALSHARTLGVAMQLTNILRDVGEDGRRGRCYIPREDLERFGLTSDEVLRGGLGADERWTALMRFEIARARELYAQAMPGIALLAPDARRCATVCATGYAGILGAIEDIGYDTFGTRARLSTIALARLLWSAWRTPLGDAAALGGGVPLNDSELATYT